MFVISTGLVCGVGLTSPTACAAMRTGISRFGDLPFYDTAGEAIVGSAVPDLGRHKRPEQRLLPMLVKAMSECAGAAHHLLSGDVPLFLCLPEADRPGMSQLGHVPWMNDLSRSLGFDFDVRSSRVIQHGHTGSFEALRMADTLLRRHETDVCLIAAADSLINAESLHWLEQNWRLKTSENSDGVIPGEASAAVLVARAPGDRTTPATYIAGIGQAEEKAHILSEEPLMGVGLAKAVRMALGEAKTEMHNIDFRLSDVTGEQYGFKEQTLMVSRTMMQRRPAQPIWHPTDSIGDVGAAAGLVQLIVARHAWERGYAPGVRALACTSSVGGSRAAVVLYGQAPGRSAGSA